MANYNKSFNFRNGVQVDNDNFIVNANGLVGIGTSIPREFLDVYGTAKFTGLVTARNLVVTGVSTFYSDVKVGSGITLNASTGIVSATAFYGDGQYLLNVEQVAVDGWVVNAGNLSTTSKVGIGTTIPYYSLQVGLDPLTGNGLSIDALTGNVNTTGIITAPSFVGDIEGNINSSGVSTFSGGILGNVTGNINSSGVSTFSGGILGNVTGNINSSGVSTFSGGILGNVTGNLTGNVTGNLTGNVTGNLTGNVTGNLTGNVTGNINSSGVSTFSGGILGNVTGNLTGNVTGNINSSGVSTFSGGILGNVTGNINSSGVSTFSGGILGNVTGNLTGNVTGNLTGNVTGNLTGNVTGNLTGNVTGNINSSGVSTFSGGILGNVTGNLTGNVTGNINSSGVSTFSGGILGNVTGNINSSGVSTFSGGILGNVTGNLTGNVTGIASTARDLTSDARVNITDIISQTSSSGISTVSTRLYAESIGVGTNSPSSDIHIRRTSTSKLQITSDTAEATITLGRSTSLTENNGALRFGNTSGLYPYSTQKTLDIINYDTGNINHYLHFGFSGVGTGNFNWICGQSASNPLMSLTYEGNLGLGITNPTSKLYVVGSSYITGVTTVNNNLNVNGNVNCSGNLTGNIVNINATGVSTFSDVIINGSLNALTSLYVVGSSYITGVTTVNNNLNVNGNVNCSGNLTGNIVNINATGVSTFSDVIINGSLNALTSTSIFGYVGIETSEPTGLLQVGSGNEFGTVVVATASTIGVSTTIIVGINTSGITLGLRILEIESIIASGTTVVSIGTGQVGIGTTTLNAGEENDVSLSFGTGYVSDRVFVIDGNKSVGIGTTNPTSKLTVHGGDVSVGINTSNGLVLTSANGTKYRLIVSNAGVLSTVLVP